MASTIGNNSRRGSTGGGGWLPASSCNSQPTTPSGFLGASAIQSWLYRDRGRYRLIHGKQAIASCKVVGIKQEDPEVSKDGSDNERKKLFLEGHE